MSLAQFKCKVVRETGSPANDGLRTFSVQQGYHRSLVRGPVSSTLRLDGLTLTFHGRWKSDMQHGNYFGFEWYESENAMRSFLASESSLISKRLADQLLKHYGAEKLEALFEGDSSELLKIKGVKNKALKQLVEAWQQHRFMWQLVKFLAPYGINDETIKTISDELGSQAVALIENDPYLIAHISGVGFKVADAIGQGRGIALDAPSRVRAGLVYALHLEGQGGNTALRKETLVRRTVREISTKETGITMAALNEALEGLVNDGRVIKIGDFYCHYSHYWTESRILELLQKRIAEPPVALMEPAAVDEFIGQLEGRQGYEFAEEQRESIRMLGAGNRLLLIAGHAGTGKSTGARGGLDLLSQFCGRHNITCMALSGIAADRIRKAAGYESNTIHATCGLRGPDVDAAVEKLPYRVVVLDESSMVNSDLFLEILERLDDQAVFVPMGDDGQLRPIGAGNVFADLLDGSGFPMVRYTKIHRQSEDSVLAIFADQIRRGQIPEGYDLDAYEDFGFHPCDIAGKPRGPYTEQELEENDTNILLQLMELALEYRERIDDIVTELQVLTPMRRGILGVDHLNEVLQEIINPYSGPEQIMERNRCFKLGDKVVHTLNKEMRVVSETAYNRSGFLEKYTEKRKVCNGQVGVIVKVDVDREQIYVRYPGEFVTRYTRKNLGGVLQHAFALSTHKAQGSEYRYILCPLSMSHAHMLDRSWFYTTLTRARERAGVVGQRAAFEYACTRKGGHRHHTVLSLLLQNAACTSA